MFQFDIYNIVLKGGDSFGILEAQLHLSCDRTHRNLVTDLNSLVSAGFLTEAS